MTASALINLNLRTPLRQVNSKDTCHGALSPCMLDIGEILRVNSFGIRVHKRGLQQVFHQKWDLFWGLKMEFHTKKELMRNGAVTVG